MPQDADGAGLIYLIWAAWLSWNVYWSLNLPRKRSDNGQNDRLDQSGDAGTPSAPAGLEALISEILRRDGSREVEDFLKERLAAFETTIAAFDAGDRDALRELVSPDVLDVFSQVIEAREARQRESETVFSRIDPPEIVDGLIDETHMEVSVRFVGECFKLCRGAAGQPIDQTLDKFRSIDIWTFGRMLSPRERAWRVLATGTGA